MTRAEEAKECLEALKYIEEEELKNGFKGHQLKGMRPILLVKKLLSKIIHEEK